MTELNVSLGCDPEVFLVQGGKYIPACGLVGGTKRDPLKINDDGTMVQEDGVTVEFNTPAVHTGPQDFFDQVIRSYELVNNFVRTKNIGYSTHIIPSVTFKPEQLLSLQARTLGCDPDKYAHKRGARRIPPKIEDLGNDRCAAGHIHVGYDKEKSGIPGFAMVQLIEAGAYVPFLRRDRQGARRKFYGIPGLYRDKPYGIEYRTPSAMWMCSDGGETLITRIHSIATWAINNPTQARELWSEINFALIEQVILVESAGITDQMIDLFDKFGAYSTAQDVDEE